MKSYLVKNAKIYQHLYATLYATFYSRNNKFGAENWSIFELCYIERINSRKNNGTVPSNSSIKQAEIAKNSEHYKRSTLTINEFELIPITDKYQFVSKKVPQKRLDQQQKS